MYQVSSHDYHLIPILAGMTNDLNSIRLNPVMLAGLYEKSLVEISEKNHLSDLKYLGNNLRNVTILINDPAHSFFPEDQLSFLTKILGACKLNIGDVAIVNTNNYTDTKAIIKSLHPEKIILFGVELNENNIDTVAAPSINNLVGENAEAKALKSKLWGALKQMFGV